MCDLEFFQLTGSSLSRVDSQATPFSTGKCPARHAAVELGADRILVTGGQTQAPGGLPSGPGSAEAFFGNPEIVLHEFFHVLRQWETRELSVMRYVIEWLRRGYWDNRYEIEAREFAADQLHRFRAMLSRHEAAAGVSPESLRARTARQQTPPERGPESG